MVIKIKYPCNFSKVMMFMKWQAEDGIKHFRDDYPEKIKDPQELWHKIKPRVTYKKDPKGIELFQSYQTLFYNNYYDEPGAGDCDCFVVTLLTACFANNLPYKIVLAGRDTHNPVHIYIKIKGKVLDMTRPKFNSERYYPYLQEFSFP